MKNLDKQNIEDILSLTPMQEGMLFHYLNDPEGEQYFEQLSLGLSGKVERILFDKAWNFVIETNEMLRTVFRWEKLRNPIQIVLKGYTFQSRYYDFSGKGVDKKEKHLEEIRIKDKIKKFDLEEVPFRVTLCKIEKNKYKMIISNHHILYDGWSNGIILKEFFEAYTTLSVGKELGKPVKTKFKEFVKWIHHLCREKQERFWQEYFIGFDAQPGLSIKRQVRKGKEAAGIGNYSIPFGKELKRELGRFIKEHKITMASLLYTAWGLLLQRYNNSRDVIFGTTVSGRTAQVQGIEKIVGLFINTVPLRLQAHSNEKVEHLLQRNDYGLKTREAYDTMPLVNIKEYSRMDNGEVLFDSIVVIENYPLGTRLMRENSSLPLSIDSYEMIEKTHYDLTVIITLCDEIEVKFNYKRESFDEETIMKLSGHLKVILQSILKYPGKPIASIDILLEKERHKILYEFNNTRAYYPEGKTVYQLFSEQVKRTPDKTALVGSWPLAVGNMKHTQLTYGELNRGSNQLAYVLRHKDVGPNTIVGIMVERSLEMVVGIFAVLKAGGAYLPIDPGCPEERMRYILVDSRPNALITTRTIAKESEKIFLEDLSVLSVPSVIKNKTTIAFSNLKPATSPSNLAYIIYTSGSTGKPKGVMVNHNSVVNVLLALQEKYPFRESDAYLLKTAYVFDVSITELFGWFLGGGRLAVLEKDGEKDPYKILNAIENFTVTHINFVPSMFNVFVTVLNLQNLIKLASLRYIFLAGETLLPGIVKKFRDLNTTIMLENLYGPTEGTVYASRYSLSQSNLRDTDIIPIGSPLENIGIYIMDRDDHWQPIGVPGELCIGGAGLARGYLNNPELTAEKFQNMSYMSHMFYIYRTGDLAWWLADGNIQFLGRIDRQVKIRGFRIELGEIENQLLKHDEVKEAVVIVHQDESGRKDLCAYVVPSASHSLDFDEVRDYLSQTLPEYMIPTYFVKMEKIPRTFSGKTDRKALAKVGIFTETSSYKAPHSEIEKKLVGIWSGILRIEKEKIGIDANFFRIGGHSLKATSLAASIHKEFNKKVSPKDIFEMPTIRKLSEYISGSAEEEYCPIKTAEAKEYYTLSSAQQRLYITQQMDETGITYNIPYVIRVQGPLDEKRLQDTFHRLIRRHESLRTSFASIKDEPVQRIYHQVEFEIEYYDMKEVEVKVEVEEERTSINSKDLEGTRGLAPLPMYPAPRTPHPAIALISSFIRPFDLSHAPLFRVGLNKIQDQEHILMLDMHHIISDGLSLAVFEKEVAALYRGENLPGLRIQYKDFSEWQNSPKGIEAIKKQEDYWLKVFSRKVRRLDIPLDYPRDSMGSAFAGEVIRFEVDEKLTKGLKEMALVEEVTSYMILMAVYNILLSKYSGREDIVVGTPVSGRTHADLNHIMGMFVNLLAMRNYPEGKKTFRQLLGEVKTNSLKAFNNQDYQFELLLQALHLDREVDRNSLLDTTFVVQNMERSAVDLPGLKFIPYPFQNETAKFEMVLEAEEKEEKINLVLQYAAKLYKKETIETFCQHYLEIIRAILANPEVKLMDIQLQLESHPAETEKINLKTGKFEFDF